MTYTVVKTVNNANLVLSINISPCSYQLFSDVKATMLCSHMQWCSFILRCKPYMRLVNSYYVTPSQSYDHHRFLDDTADGKNMGKHIVVMVVEIRAVRTSSLAFTSALHRMRSSATAELLFVAASCSGECPFYSGWIRFRFIANYSNSSISLATH